jgi:NADPH:quinone reductase
MASNRQFRLAARPTGLPTESDFTLTETSVPAPAPGQVLVRSRYLSVDPYMRGRMSEAKSYAAPMQVGDVVMGAGVGEVVQSQHPGFAAGDFVYGSLGWQEYALAPGESLRKVDPGAAPLSAYLSVLGSTGLTAYFGLLDLTSPQPGETVVVSGAAGAVGMIVGQIAKLKGCRAIGIAGTDAKVEYLVQELGFDGAFNYKTEHDYVAKLEELCPNGADVYFDNVGGAIADAVMAVLNKGARVSVCGQISQYNNTAPEMGPRLLPVILTKQIRVQGFMIGGYASRFEEGRRELAAWVREGKLKYRDDVVEGFEHLPRTFIGMLQGANTGKALVKV